jgi:hypothetical protein
MAMPRRLHDFVVNAPIGKIVLRSANLHIDQNCDCRNVLPLAT